MNAIEALEGAIEMLKQIKTGGRYSAKEYRERLQAYEDALARHKAAAAMVAAKQVDLRSMSEQFRQGRG